MRFSFTIASRGSALLLVLWSLVLLSLAVIGVVEIVESSVSHASHLALESRARALAASGLAVAMHPQIKAQDSLLDHSLANGEKWTVSLHGEAGRLNLNYILNGDHREILVRLFSNWGLKAAEAETAADCLYDWIHSGPETSPHGAKAADYQRAGRKQLPTGLPFSSLDEARNVIGMREVEKAKPNWQDSFTLWSDGPLDVNEASADVLAAFFALPVSLTESFVEKRNGPDGLPDTDDDVQVKDAAGLKATLGLGNKTITPLANQISFVDSIRRVTSTGNSSGLNVTLFVIVRLQSSPPEYLLWHEL